MRKVLELHYLFIRLNESFRSGRKKVDAICLNLVARNMVQTLGLVQCFDKLAGHAENSAGHEKTRIHIISK
jgi:hypothetical protein